MPEMKPTAAERALTVLCEIVGNPPGSASPTPRPTTKQRVEMLSIALESAYADGLRAGREEVVMAMRTSLGEIHWMARHCADLVRYLNTEAK